MQDQSIAIRIKSQDSAAALLPDKQISKYIAALSDYGLAENKDANALLLTPTAENIELIISTFDKSSEIDFPETEVDAARLDGGIFKWMEVVNELDIEAKTQIARNTAKWIESDHPWANHIAFLVLVNCAPCAHSEVLPVVFEALQKDFAYRGDGINLRLDQNPALALLWGSRYSEFLYPAAVPAWNKVIAELEGLVPSTPQFQQDRWQIGMKLQHLVLGLVKLENSGRRASEKDIACIEQIVERGLGCKDVFGQSSALSLAFEWIKKSTKIFELTLKLYQREGVDLDISTRAASSLLKILESENPNRELSDKLRPIHLDLIRSRGW